MAYNVTGASTGDDYGFTSRLASTACLDQLTVLGSQFNRATGGIYVGS